jgi:hypothetical protein
MTAAMPRTNSGSVTAGIEVVGEKPHPLGRLLQSEGNVKGHSGTDHNGSNLWLG